MPAADAAGTGTLEVFSVALRCQGPAVAGMAVSLDGDPLPGVDEAGNGLRERQHCPGREEFIELVAILSGQTVGQVLAGVSHAAKRGSKETGASVAATQLLVPIIHEIEAG
jgi:hypothetical protein